MDEALLSISEMAPRELLRVRRRALGWTQHDLAEMVGTTQSVIAAVERGRRTLTTPMEVRLRDALKSHPADLVRKHRAAIKTTAADHGFTNVRVFGSVARGTAAQESDVDLFVEYADPQHRDAFALFRLQRSLENLIGVHVDVNLLTGQPFRTSGAQQALDESVAL